MTESSDGGLRPLTRFTGREGDYARHRPGYPEKIVDMLRAQAGIGPGSAVADVGSGTGIFSRMLIEAGCRVWGVEPNAAMRAVQEELLGSNELFASLAGSAEAIPLPDGSVDLVTVAQAFHWFDPEATRREFARVLRPGGRVALVWNSRRDDASPFLAGYEALLARYCPDYARVDHRRVEREVVPVFFGDKFEQFSVPSSQRFDWAGLCGRLMSCSYAPLPGAPNHAPLMSALRDLFDTHLSGDCVEFVYETTLYLGHVTV